MRLKRCPICEEEIDKSVLNKANKYYKKEYDYPPEAYKKPFGFDKRTMPKGAKIIPVSEESDARPSLFPEQQRSRVYDE